MWLLEEAGVNIKVVIIDGRDKTVGKPQPNCLNVRENSRAMEVKVIVKETRYKPHKPS